MQEIRGVRITRLGQRVYHDALIERQDPQGKTYYWIGGDPPTGVIEEGTDFGALAQCYVSVTPVHMDMTSHTLIERLRSWEKDSLLK
jgi:5'-nucleotidase